MICSSFFLKVKFFIFKENNGISALRIYALNKVMVNKNQGLENISKTIKESEYFRTKGKLIINKVLAGVGKPIKESVWRASILKLAKR